MKVAAPPRLARSPSGSGCRRSARCATRASTSSRRTSTAAGRRSTTGPRSSSARSTGRSCAVGASMGGYCALALAAARRSAWSAWCSSARARTRTRSTAGASGRSRSPICAPATDPALADEDADLEHLAVAQEAMRDRLDLTGVVASFGGPLLVCVGDADELVSVDEARALADSALDGRLEVFPARALRRRRPARALQRGAARVREPVEDVTLDELRGRLDDEASRSSTSGRRSSSRDGAGAHCDPRQGHIPGAVNLPLERILECRSARRCARSSACPRAPRSSRTATSAAAPASRRRCSRAPGIGAELRRLVARVVASCRPVPASGERRLAQERVGEGSARARSSGDAVSDSARSLGGHRQVVRVLLDPGRDHRAVVTSAWNWIPQAGSSRRKACRQTSLSASAVPLGGISNV